MPQKPTFNPNDWDVVDDQWEDVPATSAPAPVNTPPPEQGWFSKAWSAVSDPLWEGPTRLAKQFSDYLTTHTADESMLGSQVRGFFGGAAEGAGNVLSSLTSPLSLATLGTGGLEVAGAKAGLPQVARIASMGTKALSAPVAAHGAVEMFRPDASMGERAMGLLEAAGGGAGMVHTPPAVRPRINPSVVAEDVHIPAGPIVAEQADMFAPLAKVEEPPPPSIARPASEVDDMVNQLGLGNEWEAVNTPVDEVAGPLNNASGDSDASLEAISRAQSLKQKGQQFVVYTKSGEKKILGRGVDAHDYVAQGYLKDGESFGLEDKNGNFQLLDDRGGKIPAPKPPTQPSKTTQFLQRDLQGAKPRFNIGTDSYTPVFANDLDKALFIIAQKNPSRRDADFLRFVMESTGLDENAARAAGMDVRKAILNQVRGQEPGNVSIPQIFGKEQVASVTQITPETLPVPESGGAAPPSGPPRPPAGPSGVPPTPTPGQPPSGGGTPPVSPPITPQAVPSAMARLNQQASMANPAQKAGLFQNTQAFIKTLMTAYDFSAPGRQGKGLITHGEFWKSFDDMFRAWGSENGAKVVNDSIVNHPSGFFKPTMGPGGKLGQSIAEKAGLAFGEHGARPEMFGSKLAEKLPGVKRSERAYTAFLDKARTDVFAKLAGEAKRLGRGTPDVYKQIAESINTSTGVGNLHGVEHSATAMKALNSVFFAPKLMASRVQMYTRVLNPKTYTTLDPIVRKEALRSLFGIVGTGLVLGEVAKGMGATVVNDPTNSDFRKIKLGNSRIDNFAGLQQYGVAAARLLTGESTSSVSGRTSNLEKPKFGGQTRQDVVSNFLTNKLAPIPSFVWAWMGNKEFDGTPFEVKQAMLQRTIPLVMQDLYDIAKEDPSLIPLGLLPMFGEGVQTYGR